jgi:hypothetical protein
MKCREFEKRWNDVLDARLEGLPELERDLEVHASTCERCQSVSARYQLLRQAVAAWGPPPTPSAASLERLRCLSVSPRPRRVVGRWVRLAIPLATAAAVLALAWLDGRWRTDRPIPVRVETCSTARVSSPRPIKSALEEATSATIDLALEASAPAARIGRDFLTLEEEDADPLEASPSEAGIASDDSAASNSATDMLQTVGERVNAGVKPISGSARHAFSFLLGPPPGPEKPPASRSEASGEIGESR